MWFDFLAFLFWLLYEPFHHFRVFAWVNSQHSVVEMRHTFLCHCFILVLGIHILEYLLGRQRHSVGIISFDPQTRSMVILIVCYIDCIVPKILLCSFIAALSFNLQKTIFHILFYLLRSYSIYSGSRWSICC